jgi:8-oxo-dGTP diphosphatase
MSLDPRLNEIYDCLYRVAVKAIIIRDRKILFVKDNEDIGWSLPGGGVDHGEDLNTALMRELSEEINVPADHLKSDFKIVATTIGQVKGGIPRCNLHFLVSLTTDEIRMTGEINSMEWISVDELHNLTFESSAGDTLAILTKVLEI